MLKIDGGPPVSGTNRGGGRVQARCLRHQIGNYNTGIPSTARRHSGAVHSPGAGSGAGAHSGEWADFRFRADRAGDAGHWATQPAYALLYRQAGVAAAAGYGQMQI